MRPHLWQGAALAVTLACAPATDGGTPDGADAATAETTADGGFRPPPGCSGVALTADGALVLDVKAVEVQGQVTLEGNTSSLLDGRTLLFTARDTQTTATVQINANGGYRALLSPGQYDIFLSGNASGCEEVGAPCTEELLHEGLRLTANGSLDLNVTVARVQVSVTIQGNAPTSGGQLGTLTLVPSGGLGGASFTVRGSQSVGTLALAPGQYDAVWSGNGAACGRNSPSPLMVACGTAVVARNLALVANGAVTVDIPAVRVQGSVTVNGALAGGTRGLSFQNNRGGLVTVDLGDDGRFNTAVVPEEYDAHLAGASSCEGTSWPCNAGLVRANAGLRADGSLDIEIGAISVQGTVFMRGSAPLGNAGSVVFTRDGVSTAFRIGSGGHFSARLLPGRYKVTHAPDASACRSSLTPCTMSTLAVDVNLTTDGVLDGNLLPVALTLSVRHSGGVFAVSSGGAQLWLDSLEGAGSFQWPENGAAFLVAPGRYRVRFKGAACDVTSGALPCGDHVISEETEVTADGLLELQLEEVQVQYALTLNGADYPVTSGAASLLWVPMGSGAAGGNGRVSTAQAAARLVPGRFVVAWRPDQDCGTMTSRGLPCSLQVVAGCP